MATGFERVWLPGLAALAFAWSVQARAQPAAEAQAPPLRRTWTAGMTLEADRPARAANRAAALAELHGGRVEDRTDGAGTGATLHLLLPANQFTNVLAALEATGTVVSRQVESRDVAASYAEAETQLHHQIARRDRLRDLLEQTASAGDAIAVETDLNRTQVDADSAEARLRSYKVQIEWGKAILTFHPATQARRKILGPLGYLFKGISWTVGKLFVIRSGEPAHTTASAREWAPPRTSEWIALPPAPPPISTDSDASSLLNYVVQEGDTLEGIGRLFVVTVEDLRHVNPGIGAQVSPGEAIAIPPANQ